MAIGPLLIKGTVALVSLSAVYAVVKVSHVLAETNSFIEQNDKEKQEQVDSYKADKNSGDFKLPDISDLTVDKIEQLIDLDKRAIDVLYGIRVPKWDVREEDILDGSVDLSHYRFLSWSNEWKKMLDSYDVKDRYRERESVDESCLRDYVVTGKCAEKLEFRIAEPSSKVYRHFPLTPVWGNIPTNLNIEEAIARNRNKLKEIFDALFEQWGGFGWFEKYWDILVERMKEVVPKELQLHVVDYLWLGLPEVNLFEKQIWLLMDGKWKIGDANFQSFAKRFQDGKYFSSAEEYGSYKNRLTPGEGLSGKEAISLINDKYLKVKEIFVDYKKGLSSIFGIDIPEWSDRVWGLIVFSLFFESLSPRENLSAIYKSLSSYFLHHEVSFETSFVRNLCFGRLIRGKLDGRCLRILKEDLGSIVWARNASFLNLPRSINRLSNLSSALVAYKNKYKQEHLYDDYYGDKLLSWYLDI